MLDPPATVGLGIARDDSFDFSSPRPVSRAVEFPFMVSEHNFDTSQLARVAGDAADTAELEEVCLKFEKAEVVYIHGLHETGWADATLLKNGRRGWVPINYFVHYTDVVALPLFAAAANFVARPRSYRDRTTFDKTFSPAAVNEVVNGVRSLLQETGTLNRDSSITKRHETIRKARKALLTELAHVVSMAKANKYSTDEAIIEKIMRGVLRTVFRATILITAWKDSGENIPADIHQEDEVSLTRLSGSSASTQYSLGSTDSDIRLRSFPDHKVVPSAEKRLREVDTAFRDYLSQFIPQLTPKPEQEISLSVLTNTRYCMLACRELLVVVEATSDILKYHDEALETLKDRMFSQLRQLVGAARQVVAVADGTSDRQFYAATSRLASEAHKCIALAESCTHAASEVLKSHKVELPPRSYPIFDEIMPKEREIREPKEPKELKEPKEPKAELHAQTMNPATDLIVRDGKVKGGTLEALIHWICGNDVSEFERSSFILSFRLFASPIDVASLLVAEGNSAAIECCRLWIESFWRAGDDVALPILEKLHGLTKIIEKRRNASLSRQLVPRSLDKPITEANIIREGPYENISQRRRSSQQSWKRVFSGGSSINVASVGSKLLDFEPEDIATQLTLMTHEVFTALKPDELLDQRFASSKRHLGLAPHVAQLILGSNHLAAFVGDTVLTTDEQATLRHRKHLLRFWLRVAKALYTQGDLNCVVTIMLALQSRKILRLRKVWEMLSPKSLATFEELGVLTTPERNFSTYRREQKALLAAERPCIPYIGLFLSDLTLLDEGNPRDIPLSQERKGINIDRYLRSCKIIATLQKFQGHAVLRDLQPNSSLQSWLRAEMAKSWNNASRDTEEQWRRSILIEPA